MRGMLRRAFRAARLDRATYREVSVDPEAVLNAAGVVILAGIAIGLGMTDVFGGEPGTPPDLDNLTDRLLGVWLSIMIMMVGWILWAAVVRSISRLFAHGDASFRQILRVLGICYGPGTLLVLASVPGLGVPSAIVGSLWVLVAGTVAVHEIQDVNWLGASLSTLLGWAMGFWIAGAFLRPT